MTRRMIFPLIFGIAGIAVLLMLGNWQTRRMVWKNNIIAEIDREIVAPTVPLPDQITPDMKYMPVTATGTTGSRELHMLTSSQETGTGYRVITPFTVQSAPGSPTASRTIMLDRGFLPASAKDAPRPQLELDVEGNLYWPDDLNSSTPDPDLGRNIWFTRDVPTMAAALGTEPVLIIARQDTGQGITPWPVDSSTITNNHVAYAFTWYSLAFVWLVMTGYLLWRIRRRTI
jgi:surfeit locus 1 family protein